VAGNSAARDLATTVMGQDVSMPVLISPTGVQAVHPEGEVAVAPLMTMTLTCDHRALDGAVASDFLRTVKAYLEEPGLML